MRELRRLSWDEPAPADLLDEWLEDLEGDELEATIVREYGDTP